MANPNFVATMSSNEIWRDTDDTRCITDDLDAIEADIADLETGKADTDHDHSGYALTGHSHSYNDLSDTPTIPTIPDSLPANGGNADTVGGKHASDFADSGHNHDTEYIKKALQFVNDNGDVKENISGTNVLATIATKTAGIYTFYSDATSSNKPKANIGWRYLVHKTNVNYAWVIAFGSDGSVFTNYLHNGAWVGWNTVLDITPTTLWSGAKVMTTSETIVPTKKLSECRNGWMLEWSDYNTDSSSSANTNFVQTPIFKRSAVGTWDGRNMMFPIPNYLSDDGVTQSTAIKQLIVYDNKLVGHIANDKNTANLDVALRAVYEF